MARLSDNVRIFLFLRAKFLSSQPKYRAGEKRIADEKKAYGSQHDSVLMWTENGSAENAEAGEKAKCER